MLSQPSQLGSEYWKWGIVSRLACFWSCFDGCYYCPFMVTGYASQPSSPRIHVVHWTSNTQSQTHQKIHRNDIKTATKHPKIEFLEKFKKKIERYPPWWPLTTINTTVHAFIKNSQKNQVPPYKKKSNLLKLPKWV